MLVFEANGGKYHDVKGFHLKDNTTDRECLYPEKIKNDKILPMDNEQTNRPYAHTKF